jgi:hypothetical protein
VTIPIEIVADWNNLAHATYQAARHKHRSQEVQRFLARLDDHLSKMCEELLAGTISVGKLTRFQIRDPKPRTIHAPCFRERVIHHALMNHAGPVLDRSLVDDSFACRLGKGSLAAVRRAQHFIRRFPWYAKLDIRSYFASVDHQVLKQLLLRRFKPCGVTDLLFRIIDSHDDQPGRGIPIGALTSQGFANFYLGPLDRRLTSDAGAAGYLRYMDDFIVWGNSRQDVRRLASIARDFAASVLQLEVKQPGQINRCSRGLPLCGYRVFAGKIELSRRRRHQFRKLVSQAERSFRRGVTTPRGLQSAYDLALSLTVHAHARQWRRTQRRLERSDRIWEDDV